MEEAERSSASGVGEAAGDSPEKSPEGLRVIGGAEVGVGSTIFSDATAAIYSIINIYISIKMYVLCMYIYTPSAAENSRPARSG